MPSSSTQVCADGHRWPGPEPACPVCGGRPVPATLSASDGPATLPQSDAAPTPPGVSGFEIERELGRGGMGVVYLARQTELNRLVALKMILSGAHAGQQERERFKIEAQAAARLQHPNIV